MAKDQNKRKEKLNQAGLLSIAKKQEVAVLHAERRRRVAVIGIGIAALCASIGIGIWLFVSYALFPDHSLWEWVPPDVPFAVSFDMTRMRNPVVSRLMLGSNNEQAVLAKVDTWLHTFLNIDDSVPIVQGKESIVFQDQQTERIVIGLKAEQQSLDRFVAEISKESEVLTNSSYKGGVLFSHSTLAWVRPNSGILFLTTREDALVPLLSTQSSLKKFSVRPQFLYNPLMQGASFMDAYIHPFILQGDGKNPQLKALWDIIGKQSQEWWVSSFADDSRIELMVSPKKDVSLSSLPKTFVMGDGIIGLGVVGNSERLYTHPQLKGVLLGTLQSSQQQESDVLFSELRSVVAGPGAVVVSSFSPLKTAFILLDRSKSFNLVSFEEYLRLSLARSVPQEHEVALPDGSRAQELRADDTAFQWTTHDFSLATGETGVIRSLPDNPLGVRFSYARVQTEPALIVFAQSGDDITHLGPYMNIFSDLIEKAGDSSESVDIMLSSSVIPDEFSSYVQGLKAIHAYQRSLNSPVTFDFEFHATKE